MISIIMQQCNFTKAFPQWRTKDSFTARAALCGEELWHADEFIHVGEDLFDNYRPSQF